MPFLPREDTQGTRRPLTPRGGQNLYEGLLRKTARGFVCEKSEIKRVIREAVTTMPTKSNNTGGRGGKRPGAGRKKTAVREKYENGNPGGRKLEVLDIPDTQGVDMPEPHEFLSARQHDGSTLSAGMVRSGLTGSEWQKLCRRSCSNGTPCVRRGGFSARR